MSALDEMQNATLYANSEGHDALGSLTTSFDELDDFGGLTSSLIGMNNDLNSRSDMFAAVSEYVASVQTNIDKMSGYVDMAREAFGNRTGEHVNTFVEAMKNSCKAMISRLGKFSYDINTVANTYAQKAYNIKTTLGSHSDSINSDATKYEYDNISTGVAGSAPDDQNGFIDFNDQSGDTSGTNQQ